MWLLLSSSTDDSGSKHTRWVSKYWRGLPRQFFLKGPESVVARVVRSVKYSNLPSIGLIFTLVIEPT
jgi:hypothetical protein